MIDNGLDFVPYMRLALLEAKKAMGLDEVPVGAVIISNSGEVISKGHNLCIGLNDPTAHAEILAIRSACDKVSNYRLTGCILITTLEPCIMCMGALVHARIQGLVFGARDPKAGAVVSRMDFFSQITWLNHRFWIKEGVSSIECSNVLKLFFKSKRGLI